MLKRILIFVSLVLLAVIHAEMDKVSHACLALLVCIIIMESVCLIVL